MFLPYMGMAAILSSWCWCYIPWFSLKAFLVLEKEIGKCFYHIWAWQPSCLMVQNLLNKMSIPLWQKAPCEIWWKLVKWFQTKRLKITWADNPRATKLWLQLKRITTLIIHCKFQPLVFKTCASNSQFLWNPQKWKLSHSKNVAVIWYKTG